MKYEVGLMNVQFPRIYYGLIKDDIDSRLSFYKMEGDEKKILFTVVTPLEGILAGDINEVIRIMNSLVEKRMLFLFRDRYKNYFDEDTPFFTLKANNFIHLAYKYKLYPEGKLPEKPFLIYVKFGSRIADALGFMSDTMYEIFGEHTIANTCNRAPLPVDPNAGVQHIIMYSDIVRPSPYADQQVNVLDIFPLTSDGTKGFHNIVFKELKTCTLDEISIKMTDQLGRDIGFPDSMSVSCTLKVKVRI